MVGRRAEAGALLGVGRRNRGDRNAVLPVDHEYAVDAGRRGQEVRIAVGIPRGRDARRRRDAVRVLRLGPVGLVELAGADIADRREGGAETRLARGVVLVEVLDRLNRGSQYRARRARDVLPAIDVDAAEARADGRARERTGGGIGLTRRVLLIVGGADDHVWRALVVDVAGRDQRAGRVRAWCDSPKARACRLAGCRAGRLA